MKKLVIGMHMSIDGFVAGSNGEMDWIKVDQEIFDYTSKLTEEADTALYGRVTYQMMDGYWPTAGEQPGASKHDIEHSHWYNQVPKVVVSNTLQEADLHNTTIIRGGELTTRIQTLKQGAGKNIQVFGSPSVVHALTQQQLIDEYWLFVNPIIIGAGIPMFKDVTARLNLRLQLAHAFSSGVTALHYTLA